MGLRDYIPEVRRVRTSLSDRYDLEAWGPRETRQILGTRRSRYFTRDRV